MELKITDCLNRFSENIEKDKHHRYRSWEHCYKIFREYLEKSKKRNLDESSYDYLALHLAFYLASWGMYRGSSFLLNKDYKVHIPIVKVLFKEEYKQLCGIHPSKYLEDPSTIVALEKLIDELRETFNRIRGVSPQEKISDTLISKVILGTVGAIPAYDRYVKKSITKLNNGYLINASAYISSASVKALSDFYLKNIEEFDSACSSISRKEGIDYPPMKILDMYFFQYGMELEK